MKLSQVSLLLIASLCANIVVEAAPRLLPFQCRIADATGAPVPDGVRVIRFRISESPVDPTFAWPGELHRATINGGLINVVLGSKTPMDGLDFGKQLFLEVTVDSNNDGVVTEADSPMLPRQAILPVLFAHEAGNSQKLSGHDWAAVFGTNDPRLPIPGTKLADNSISGKQLALLSVSSRHIEPGAVGVEQLTQALIDRLSSPVPVGTINAYGGLAESIPEGWLLCDGSALSSKNPRFLHLYESLRTSWGDGTTAADGARYLVVTNEAARTDFNLPDLRGFFLRGVSGSTTNDPDRTLRKPSRPGGNSGDNVGTLQLDEFAAHTHPYDDIRPHGTEGTEVDAYAKGNSDSVYRLDVPRVTSARGGKETRPKNASVFYIIRF